MQAIAERADVGFGSFYNHFTSKAELFDAAVADALHEYGQAIDEHLRGIQDPAEVMAASFRIAARLARTHLEVTQILRHRGLEHIHSEIGLAPRALRDVEEGVASGRFDVPDPLVALSALGGGQLALLELKSARPDVSGDEAAADMAEMILCMLGLPREEAREVARRPLPALD
ncbi:TetR/AcrR family transcriptional regulator [Streptomyces sp. NPDC002328]|uniref:TetR/AcrR family transcriptional regulator n=1 Tax=Streptomyces sp. NPDC002328 TaxID=3364642 RepID=UPI003689F12A